MHIHNSLVLCQVQVIHFDFIEVEVPIQIVEAMAIIEMQVHMDCGGCEKKIKKALQKLKGVDDIDIEMGIQKVTVTGYADEKKILKTVRKTGRRAELWQLPYNPELRNHNYNPATQYAPHQQQNQNKNHHSFGGPSVPPMFNAPQHQPGGSSYNYYKHGYENNYHNRHSSTTSSSTIFGNQTGAAFSDENPNACIIM